MWEINIKDYRIHNLQKEYNKYSKYIMRFQNHVETVYRENILNINDRNNYLKVINDILRMMNATYNNNMLDICKEEESEEESEELRKHDIITMMELTNMKSEEIYDDIGELVEMCKLLGVNPMTMDEIMEEAPFREIKDKLLAKIARKIGFKTIKDALRMLMSEQYERLYEADEISKIRMYNKIYVPLGYTIERIEGRGVINFKKTKILNEVLIDNCARMYVKMKNEEEDKYIRLEGYFKYESLNIVQRTAQICNNFIYQKKKAIESYMMTRSKICEKFKRAYIKNISMSDIIVLTLEELVEKMEGEYKKYMRITNLSFMNLMKEFVKDERKEQEKSGGEELSVEHMYTVIKLLLLGSEENINVAGLLYGISKEKNPRLECSIADIIYKNLSYVSQIKLKKTATSIKNELDKIKSLTVDDVDLKKQIVVCKNMPNAVKKAALEKVDEMKSSNNEYYKQLLYVKTLLNYPWISEEDDNIFADIGKEERKSRDFLDTVIKKLDDRVYGHKKCKDSIKELIGKWISNPSSSGSALGLVGPPGVGKTLIAKAIGESLNIPFVQITLGGQNDGEILHGHGYTYSGAQPGMVIKKMCEAGSGRCIMYFDELDKACKKHDSNEIYNILIHMIDKNTNKEFQDRFFQEINFPLNKVLFIFSYNESSLIDKILLDRIREIDVKPFKLYDKIAISEKFLIPEMLDVVGFNKKSIKIDGKEIELIVEQYTYEPGVRELKRKLEEIFLKMNLDRIYKKNLFKSIDIKKEVTEEKPIILNKDMIIKYLGKQKMQIQEIHTEDTVGVINGLYATDAGKGGVLPIQVYINYTGNEKFTLKLTGSQRKVMRESVISAFTTAIHHIKEEIRKEFIKTNPHGFHIHTPGGGVPKDGPSAGCAFATAFISRILNKPIRHDIAMTGEIELTGKVTKIGGLQYKLTGAKRAGVTLALVSKENEEDVETIKKDYKDIFDDNFKVILIENLKEVLQYAIVDYDKEEIM